MIGDARTFERGLAALRRERDRGALAGGAGSSRHASVADAAVRERSEALAERLAGVVNGERVRSDLGSHIRIEHEVLRLPIDRDRLARLPGLPPAEVPLVCLDTETTGLATAAGTFVFLVGLGWWQGDRFRQTQLLLPDQSDERALLAALRELIPDRAWLVTYNGRGFDWPLLVTRYRMAREDAPGHAGHLDLLPFVRRVFRHRLPDARLRTVERELLGVRRHEDVEGWEIPGRYLAFLRGEGAGPLVDVVRHNDEDVRSLARLVAHVVERLGDPTTRSGAPRGDLVGLARVFRDARRHDEALDCLDGALADPDVDRGSAVGRDGRNIATSGGSLPVDGDAAWGDRHGADRREGDRRTTDRLVVERARTLRCLGRDDEALEQWRAIAAGAGSFAAVAWIEVAKALEHRLRDPEGALDAADAAARLAERTRSLGRPLPILEADLSRRRRRLRARIIRRTRAARPADRSTSRHPPRHAGDAAPPGSDAGPSRGRGPRGGPYPR